MYFRKTKFTEIGSAEQVCSSKTKHKSGGILLARADVPCAIPPAQPHPFLSSPERLDVSGRQLKLQARELKSSLSGVNY